MNKVNRPSWDEYFLCIAKTVSLRAEDFYIRHGAIIVENKSRHIVGTGYNGIIRGVSLPIDLKDRDARRPYMIHAEENAIMNCSLNPLRGYSCTMYITGDPCAPCLQKVINFGIEKIVCIDGMSYTNQAIDEPIKQILIKSSNIIIEKVSMENFWLQSVTTGV
jgi:dCMP deaminase